MLRFVLGLMLMVIAVPSFCQQPLVFEAETVSTPVDAWNVDQITTTKWNLWSTDSDAAKKWSGGKVLQSPPVLTDREKPDDGVPVLHTVLTGIPKGEWIVTIKYGRDLGVSLDNKEWQRLSALGGTLGRFQIKNGRFEFWVDDRYALKEGPGSSYYDSITLTPVAPEKSGVANGDFEFGQDVNYSGWFFSSRDTDAAAQFVADGHAGRAVKVIHKAAEKEWTLANSGKLSVQPGQVWKATAWMKCRNTRDIGLNISGLSQGRTVSWCMASDGVMGNAEWTRVEAICTIPRGCDQIQLRIVGFGLTEAWVDDVALQPGTPAARPKPKTKVTGWAKTRVVEKLGRGMLALPQENGQVYLGWRLLAADPADVGFNLYRRTGKALPVKLNPTPLTRTTDFIDEKAPLGQDNAYWVRAVVKGKELPAGEQAVLPANPAGKPYLSLKLNGDYSANAVAVGDLDGDGKLDYVVKQPAYSIDPGQGYWEPSKDTYKLEAYRSDGTFLWRKDLGWGIEQGIWYAPYIVYDFDGDGKAEVAAKTSSGDPRGPDGRVFSGSENITILDGQTGKVKAQREWIPRTDFGHGLSAYNYASRNQLGVAFLDGKTPCLLVARGTYTLMKMVAYQLRGGKLQELWSFDQRDEAADWAGQGAHWMHTGDIDADGRDEILLGSTALDDTGKGLWNIGLGHPDFFFLSDLDPTRPGLEISYFIEPGRKENGICMIDARTGKILWGLPEQSHHVGAGMTADVDPTQPGCESWGVEDTRSDPSGKQYGGAPPRWMFSAKGELLGRDAAVPSVSAIYWDADPQREILAGSRIQKYRGQVITQAIEGRQIAWGDFIGDWREEIITTLPGELRIYTTTVPATDRRPCFLQDPIYRADVAHVTMGYPKPPTVGYFLPQLSSAMWMTTSSPTVRFGEPVQAKIVISAAAREAVAGTVKLEAPAGLMITPSSLEVNVPAGELSQIPFQVSLKEKPAPLSALQGYVVKACLEGAVPLQTQASFRREDEPLEGALLLQAEDFAAQGGGQVQLREDKAGAVGKAFSHWDSTGHWLSWKTNVPTAGKYLLAVRYCSPLTVQRQIEIDAAAPVIQNFPGTGGFGGPENDWAHYVVRDPAQKWLAIDLSAGEHTIKLTNTDGRGMNLDYLALVPVK